MTSKSARATLFLLGASSLGKCVETAERVVAHLETHAATPAAIAAKRELRSAVIQMKHVLSNIAPTAAKAMGALSSECRVCGLPGGCHKCAASGRLRQVLGAG